SRDDLIQEGLIHLWLSQRQRPGQSTSWYLQGCRFHLQHYLEVGRSVDSHKRRAKRVEEQVLPDALGDIWVAETDLDEVSARDIVKTMAGSLRPRERAVLDGLADGLSVSDIARRLNLSNPTVAKDRRRIARLAIRLGIGRPKHGTARVACGFDG